MSSSTPRWRLLPGSIRAFPELDRAVAQQLAAVARTGRWVRPEPFAAEHTLHEHRKLDGLRAVRGLALALALVDSDNLSDALEALELLPVQSTAQRALLLSASHTRHAPLDAS